jgi:phosphoglycerate kinase
MKSISQLAPESLRGKKVFLRVDFNVPVEDGKIQEVYKILANKESIDFLLQNEARVFMVSHHSQEDFSFKDIVDQIEDIIDRRIVFIEDLNQKDLFNQETGENLFFLDNIRHYPEEKKNDKEFAANLTRGFDLYINDAFPASHRNHASISAITEFLPSYTGFSLVREVEQLENLIQKSPQGKVLVVGGGKVATKVPMVKNFLDKAQHILIGGAVANNFFKARGLEIGKSIVDDEHIDGLKPILNHASLVLPEHVITSPTRGDGAFASPALVNSVGSDDWILDIGPESVKIFADIISKAEIVIWNGPLGQFEVEMFSSGTRALIEAIESTDAYTVIGGGDTISAFNKFGDLDKVDFVSTGGGAMLKFLSGKELPGLKALDYY